VESEAGNATNAINYDKLLTIEQLDNIQMNAWSHTQPNGGSVVFGNYKHRPETKYDDVTAHQNKPADASFRISAYRVLTLTQPFCCHLIPWIRTTAHIAWAALLHSASSVRNAPISQFVYRSVGYRFLDRSLYDTLRYDVVYLTCSQLFPPHGPNRTIKRKRTKNKSRSMISPVRSRSRESSALRQSRKRDGNLTVMYSRNC